MSKQNKTAVKTAARNKSRIERNIINALERAKEIVIRREETPAGMERKRMDMLSTFDRLHELSQLYRGGTSFTQNDITFTDGDDRVTIEITGKAFANLKEITEIYNRWNDDDYSPSNTVAQILCGDSWFSLAQKKPDDTTTQNCCGLLYDMYSDCSDAKELAAALITAGFDVNG